MRILVCVVAMLCAPVVAADEAEVPPLWSGQLDGSYVANSGNTNNATLGTSGQVTWQPGPYKVGASGSFIRTQTDDVVGSRRLAAALRSERTVSLRFSAYTEAAYFTDTPAGTRRQFTTNVGGLARVVESEKHPVSVSLSLAKTWEHRVVAPDRNFWGTQIDVDLQLHVNDAVAISQTGSYVHDFSDSENWRAKSSSSLTAALTDRLAIQCSYQVYRNKPDEGKQAVDTTTLISVVIHWPGSAKQ